MTQLKEAQRFLAHTCQPSHKLLIACSGGVDSMALAQLAHELSYQIGLAHVNFRLRGEEADADQALVEDFASRLQAPFYSSSFDTKGYARSKGISTQMAARELRYEWLERIRQEGGYHYLLMGHHLNDTIETSLFHLAKGGGISGISGIALRSGTILRPLIYHSKEEIRAYALAKSIVWREDASNRETIYQRNFIRRKVVPLLREVNPSLEQTAKQTYERLRQTQALVQLQAQKIWAAAEPTSDQGWACPLGSLLDLPVGQAVLVHELLREYGFNYTQCEQLVQSLSRSGAAFYSEKYECYLSKEYLYLTPLRSRLLNHHRPIPISGHKGWVKFPQGMIRWEYTEVLPQAFPSPQAEAWFDWECLPDMLYLRPVRNADRIRPFGMKGSKLVSDLMSEAGYPPERRRQTLVLCNSQGQVFWVVGLRTAHIAPLIPESRSALRLCWKPSG